METDFSNEDYTSVLDDNQPSINEDYTSVLDDNQPSINEDYTSVLDDNQPSINEDYTSTLDDNQPSVNEDYTSTLDDNQPSVNEDYTSASDDIIQYIYIGVIFIILIFLLVKYKPFTKKDIKFNEKKTKDIIIEFFVIASSLFILSLISYIILVT
jgi:hypothetical protein